MIWLTWRQFRARAVTGAAAAADFAAAGSLEGKARLAVRLPDLPP